MKTTLALATLFVIAGILAWFQFRARQELRTANASLQQTVNRLVADNAALSNQLAAIGDANKLSQDQQTELLRLRGEVALLRQKNEQWAKAQSTSRGPAGAPAAQNNPSGPPNEPVDPLEHQKRISYAKMNDARDLLREFITSADAHQGQFPSEIDDANLYTQPGYSGTNNFEIVYHGTRDAISDPSKTILIRENLAWPTVDGKWAKAYGFADGHAEIHIDPNGNFGAWEDQHLPPPRQ